MSSWRTATIGQLVQEGILDPPMDGNHGETHPKGADFVSEGIPFIMASDIERGVIDLKACKFLQKSQADRLRKGFSFEGDVLLTHKATIGRTAVVPKLKTDYIMLTPQVTYYRVKKPEELDKLFLKYYFDSKPFQESLGLLAGAGSTRAYLGITGQLKLTVRFPDISTQRNISGVLFALDEKIRTNIELINQLETIARTLYDYWFLQFEFPNQEGKPYGSSGGAMTYNDLLKKEIPSDWSVSNILAVADLLGGGTPSKKKPEYWGGHIPFFSPTEADGSIFKFDCLEHITEEGLRNSSTKLFDVNTIFITARGSVGRLVVAAEKMAMNQSCYALRPKPEVSHTFLYYLTKELIQHLQIKSSGSVFDSIVSKDIEFTTLTIPDRKIIKLFAEIAEPIFKRIALNTLENIKLAELRDWLLPMLMNGGINVGELRLPLAIMPKEATNPRARSDGRNRMREREHSRA